MTSFNSPDTWSQVVFGNQGPNMSPQAQALREIGRTSNDKTRSFQQNMVDLNTSVSFMSGYMDVMQGGIDEANKNIVQKIQDMINDIFIIFNGGDGAGDTGFDWGDLKYIFQALGALFGFQGLSGPANLIESAGYFFSHFLSGDTIFNGFLDNFFLESFDGSIDQIFEGMGLAGVFEGTPIEQFFGFLGSTASKDEVSNLATIYNFELSGQRVRHPITTSLVWQYVSTPGVAHEGDWCLRCGPVGSYPSFSQQPLGPISKITKGDKLNLSWWQRRESASFEASVAIEFYDKTGAVQSTLLPSPMPNSSTTNATWLSYSMDLTVPSSAVSLRPFARLNIVTGGSPTGHWLFDEVSLKRTLDQSQIFGLDSLLDLRFDTFLEQLTDLLDGFGFVGSLLEGLANFLNFSKSTAETAQTVAETAQTTAVTAQETVSIQGTVVTSVNNQIQTIRDDILPLRPMWEAVNLTEESTIPRIFLSRLVWNATGPVYDPVANPSADTLHGGFIRLGYSGPRKVISFIVEAVSSPCELYVVLGKMQESGDVEVLWVSDNLTPTITTSRREHAIELPSEVLLSVGETVYLGLHQRGAGNRRSLFGIEQANITHSNTIFPPQIAATFAYGSVIAMNDIIAAGSFSFSNRFVPYLSIGKNIGVGAPPAGPVTGSDDFNRADGSIGGSFAAVGDKEAEIFSNRARFKGSTDGFANYLWNSSGNRDDQYTYGYLYNPSNVPCRLILRSNSTGTECVSLDFTDQVFIRRYTSMTSFTTLASMSGSPLNIHAGGLYMIQAIGNVYKMFKWESGSWVEKLSYTDTANAIPVDDNHRFFGWGVCKQAFSFSGQWDQWVSSDI